MAEGINPLLGTTSCGIILRIIQFIFAGLILGTAAYTVSATRGWGEAWYIMGTGAWIIVALLWIVSSGMRYRPKSHYLIILVLEIVSWASLLAAWIAVWVNIGQHTRCFSDRHDKPCNTIYAASVFAIIEWMLFTGTLIGVAFAMTEVEESA